MSSRCTSSAASPAPCSSASSRPPPSPVVWTGCSTAVDSSSWASRPSPPPPWGLTRSSSRTSSAKPSTRRSDSGSPRRRRCWVSTPRSTGRSPMTWPTRSRRRPATELPRSPPTPTTRQCVPADRGTGRRRPRTVAPVRAAVFCLRGRRAGYAGGTCCAPTPRTLDVFDTLSDRITATLKSLRGKGRLSDADLDAAAQEIRCALLDGDVALPVVRDFITAIRERARGSEVHAALNPAQQVIKIVNEELIAILGGETRRLRFAKTPPTVIMLAGLQGSGKTSLAGKLAGWLRGQGHQPLLVAADLQRPNAVQQLQIVGERAGVNV